MAKEFKDAKETRLIELRSVDSEDGKMIVEGYAVRFEEPTLIGSEEYGFTEVIDRHALDTTDMKDVPLKYQHNDSKGILARTRNGSLTLTKDEFGLKIRAELQPDVSDHVDVYNCIRSGLLYQMSFAFDVKAQEIDRSVSPIKRTITKIGRLYDTSVVDFGAYPTTSIYARSLELVGEQTENLQPLVDTNEVTVDTVKRDYEVDVIVAMYK